MKYKDIENSVKIIKIQPKNNIIFSLDINLLIDKIEKVEILPNSIIIKLILPKSIVFDPLQSNHIIIDPFINSQIYILSWKLQCLNLPCQMSNINIEINF